jgi:hypothetical protein|tara:strand:+ start:3097 stop:3348 length:252 start_codon:yes stop_codon:yes gene_type:complete
MTYQDEDPARTGDFDFCNALSMSLFGRPHDESDEAYENRVAMRNTQPIYEPMSEYEIQRDLAAAKENNRLVEKQLAGYKSRWG